MVLYVLNLGVREVALGTIAAAIIGLLVMSAHFFRKRNNLKPTRFRFDYSLFKQTMFIGFPSFLAEVGVAAYLS